MSRILLALLLSLAACGPRVPAPGPATPPPAPNTGLLRPSLELDPGIQSPLPREAPATMPVIPPNPRIDAR